MPVVKFQPPRLQSSGRITVASLGHKQVGRAAAAAGLATQDRRLEELLLSCIPVLSRFRPWRTKCGCQVCSGGSWALSPLEAGLGCTFPAPEV